MSIPTENRQEKARLSSMKNQEHLVSAKTSICSYGCRIGALTRGWGGWQKEVMLNLCTSTGDNTPSVVIVYEDRLLDN